MVQRFENLTDQEVNALTTDDVERYIKLELLENGIKIPVAPAEPEYEEVPQADMIVCEVTNVEGCFKVRADAEEVCALLNLKVNGLVRADYNYSVDSSVKHESPYFRSYDDKSFVVTERRIYSAHLYKDIVHKVESNSKLRQAYEADKKIYDEEVEASTDIRSSVYDRYHNVIAKFGKLEELKSRYEDYLVLADNDKAQAMKFFKKAYSIGFDEEHYVVHGSLPEIVSADKPEKGSK